MRIIISLNQHCDPLESGKPMNSWCTVSTGQRMVTLTNEITTEGIFI